MLTRALLWTFAVVAAVELVAVAFGAQPVTYVAKPLLMLVLLAWVAADARGRVGAWPASMRWLVVGMAFAWLGDVLLMADGDGWFLGGVAAFAVMQACYLVAFLRVPGHGLVRAWRLTVIPYVLVWAGINVAVWSGAGDLRLAVVAYSALAVAMALGALDLVLRVPDRLGWRVAGGAALFVVSDSLIAVTAFGPLSAGNGWDALIMTTYIAAQAMIVTGFTRAVRG